MLESITVSRPGRDWAKMGQNSWKRVKTGPKCPPPKKNTFDPPQGSGKNSIFDRFGAHLAYPSPGSLPWQTDHKRAQMGRKRRPRGSHGPHEAVFRAPMAPRRIARWNPVRGLPGPISGDLGPFKGILGPCRFGFGSVRISLGSVRLRFGPFRAVTRPSAGASGDFRPQTPRAVWPYMGQTSTAPPGPFVQPYPRYKILTHYWATCFACFALLQKWRSPLGTMR